MKKHINDDKEPIIIADYKFDGIRIGDYMFSFVEHFTLDGVMHSDTIRKCTIQFMNPVMPILVRQKKDGKWYRGDDIFVFDGESMSVLPGVIKNPELYDDEVYLFKENCFSAKGDAYSLGVIPVKPLGKGEYDSYKKNFAFKTQTCTDDTKFGTDLTKAAVKHDDEYKFSHDRNNYKFVSKDSDFANTTTNKNNFEDAYMRELAGNFDADWAYTKGKEFGNSAYDELKHMRDVYYQQQKNKDFNFSDEIKRYKKLGGHNGQSFANGCVMRLGPIIFFAQDPKQGFRLAKIAINNTHDNPLSIKSAQSVVATGMCANYGLRRETIRKIVHFLYYDPDPLKGTGLSYGHSWAKDYCKFDFLSHRKKGSTPEEIQEADEKKLNDLIESNQFTDRSLPTAFLAINICLTSKCAEEAASRILRACGDCDTIGATAVPILAALFGLPADWVNRIWAISMSRTLSKPMTNLTPKKSNTKDENYQDNPKDIKVFDKKGRFIEHNEVSRMANEKFKHHYREYAPIEWQLKNICELMEYLRDQENNSKAANKKDLLNEIFADIKSDINFMLDKEQKYELEELSQDVKNTLENMQKITEEEIKNDDKKRRQKLKQLDAEYQARINKHRNATAKFQTKMKNQKLDNLTKENIAHINEEIKPINIILEEFGLGKIEVGHLKAKEQVINKPIKNNDLAQTQEKLNHSNELENADKLAPTPVTVVEQNNLDKAGASVVKKSADLLNGKNDKDKSDKKNVKKTTVVTNNPKIDQNNWSEMLKNEEKNQIEISSGSIQGQVQNDNNEQNELLQEKKESLQLNKENYNKTNQIKNSENMQEGNVVVSSEKKDDGKEEIIGQTQVQENDNKPQENPSINEINKQVKNGENTQKDKIVVISEKQDDSKKEISSQNKINHKPFALGGSALLIVDILLFVFRSSLTYFPAAIGTGGLVLLLFVWIYKICSRRSEQSFANNIDPNLENMEQPLINKDRLTKTAEINGSVPKQVPSNNNKNK